MVSWDESLAVGDAKFDSQHQRVFAVIKKFQISIAEDYSPALVRDILFELYICSCDHFFEEELFMKSVGYVGSEAHVGGHEEFLEKVGEVRSKIKDNSVTLRVELLEFVLSWFTDHIYIVDMMLFAWQRSQNEKNSFCQ